MIKSPVGLMAGTQMKSPVGLMPCANGEEGKALVSPATRLPPSATQSPAHWTPSTRFAHGPGEGISAQVAYRTSEAVARALLELDLPGLSKAAALLRTAAQQEMEQQAELATSTNADISSSYLPLLTESVREPCARSSHDGEYQPFSTPALSGGGMSPNPTSSRRESSGSHHTFSDRFEADAVSAAAIDWAVVTEGVRETVHAVYGKILATAEWLDELEDAEERAKEAAAAAATVVPRAQVPDEAAEDGERSASPTDQHEDQNGQQGGQDRGTYPLPAGEAEEASVATCTTATCTTATCTTAMCTTAICTPTRPSAHTAMRTDTADGAGAALSIQIPAGKSDPGSKAGGGGTGAGEQEEHLEEPIEDGAGTPEWLTSPAVLAPPPVDERPLFYAATRWALDNAVLLGAHARLAAVLRVWASVALSSPSTQCSTMAGRPRALTGAQAPSTRVLDPGAMDRLDVPISARRPTSQSDASGAAGVRSAPWAADRDASSNRRWLDAQVPGLPSMERVWRALFDSRQGPGAQAASIAPLPAGSKTPAGRAKRRSSFVESLPLWLQPGGVAAPGPPSAYASEMVGGFVSQPFHQSAVTPKPVAISSTRVTSTRAAPQPMPLGSWSPGQQQSPGARSPRSPGQKARRSPTNGQRRLDLDHVSTCGDVGGGAGTGVDGEM